MCGITGILGNGDTSIVTSMVSRLSHRGPDGFGNFESVSYTHLTLPTSDLV